MSKFNSFSMLRQMIATFAPLLLSSRNEVRDLGFCPRQQRPGFLASLGTTK